MFDRQTRDRDVVVECKCSILLSLFFRFAFSFCFPIRETRFVVGTDVCLVDTMHHRRMHFREIRYAIGWIAEHFTPFVLSMCNLCDSKKEWKVDFRLLLFCRSAISSSSFCHDNSNHKKKFGIMLLGPYFTAHLTCTASFSN